MQNIFKHLEVRRNINNHHMASYYLHVCPQDSVILHLLPLRFSQVVIHQSIYASYQNFHNISLLLAISNELATFR